MTIEPYTPPDDDAIIAAEKKLGFQFPEEYKHFIKSGYNLGNATLDALMIDPFGLYVDIYDSAENAWNNYGIEREWLPICDDNGDLYLINGKGIVRYWSHDGLSENDVWPTLKSWIDSIQK